MVVPRHEFRDNQRGFLDWILRRPAPGPSSLEVFYLSQDRRDSEELAFGDGWTLDTDPDATFAVGWIEVTGEMYALRLMEPKIQRMRFGFWVTTGLYTPHFSSEKDPPIEVLGVCSDQNRLRELLVGWENAMTEPNSLVWVKDRLASQ